MKLLARQILLTVSYTTQFSYPLTTEEIWLRLLQASTPIEHTKEALKESLGWLVEKRILETAEGFHFLPGKKETINQRKNNATATRKKLTEFQPVVQFARWMPWVLGLAITGSAAVGNARPQDDTDVLLVIQNNRLWLVRPLFIFFAYLYSKRRSWQKEEENSWCFNLWLEPSSLAQPRKTHSMYTAYEVCQADWQVSKDGCKELFFRKNSWAGIYVPHFHEYSQKKAVPIVSTNFLDRIFIVAQFFDLLNLLLFKLQLWYMRSHMTRERVQKNQAFFHPRDTRRIISQKHQELITRL